MTPFATKDWLCQLFPLYKKRILPYTYLSVGKPQRFLRLFTLNMRKLTNYFRESLNELTLVTWPKQDELVRMTILTVVFVLISSAILGAIDFGLLKAYQWFLTLRA